MFSFCNLYNLVIGKCQIETLHHRFCDCENYSHTYEHPEKHKGFILQTVKDILKTMATEDVKNYTEEKLIKLKHIFLFLFDTIDRNEQAIIKKNSIMRTPMIIAHIPNLPYSFLQDAYSAPYFSNKMDFPGKYICEIIKHAVLHQYNDEEWISLFWQTIHRILEKSRFTLWSDIIDADGLRTLSGDKKYIDDTMDFMYNSIQHFDEIESLAKHKDSVKIKRILNAVFVKLYTSMNDFGNCEELDFMGHRPDSDDPKFKEFVLNAKIQLQEFMRMY